MVGSDGHTPEGPICVMSTRGCCGYEFRDTLAERDHVYLPIGSFGERDGLGPVDRERTDLDTPGIGDLHRTHVADVSIREDVPAPKVGEVISPVHDASDDRPVALRVAEVMDRPRHTLDVSAAPFVRAFDHRPSEIPT